jgi:hypothetical protein
MCATHLLCVVCQRTPVMPLVLLLLMLVDLRRFSCDNVMTRYPQLAFACADKDVTSHTQPMHV